MIRIQQLGELTEYAFTAFNTFGAYHLNPVFVFPQSEPIRTASVGLRPITGDTNRFGDHSCHHDNLSGTLSILPIRTVDDSLSPVGFDSVDATGKVTQKTVSHVLMWGVAGEIPMRVDSSLPRSLRAPYERMHLYVSYPHADVVLITRVDPPDMWSGGMVSYQMSTFGYDSKGKRCVNGSSQYFYYSSSDTKIPECTLSPNYSFSKGVNRQYIKNPSPSVSLDSEDLAHIVGFLNHLIPPSSDVWEELSYKAANQAKALDINTIAYLHDLHKIKQTTMNTISTLRGKLSLKKVANLELGYKYGLRLTYLDTVTVLKSLDRKIRSYQGSSILRAQRQDAWVSDVPGSMVSVAGVTRSNLKCYYNSCDSGITNALRKSMSADIFPSLQNAWDLIPLSFVLDWFVDVSSLLDRIDAGTFISTLSVLSVIETTRSSFTIDAQLVPRLRKRGLQGNLTYVRYDRQLTNHLTPPRARFGEPQEFHNFVELGAIIVQRTKR